MRLTPFTLLCATGLLAVFSSTISKSPVLPLYASHLGAGPSGVGFVAAISAFTGVVFSIPAGLLADRFGKRGMLLASALVFAAVPFLYLPVTSIIQLAAVRFIHGFATAIFIPVAMALVSDLFHADRGEKMGWFSTATLTGRFMAPVAGGAIISAAALDPVSGFKTVYLVCGAAGVCALLLSLRLPDTGSHSANRSWTETFSTFRAIASDRRIVVTSAVEAAILFAYGTFETFLPLHAKSAGISPYRIGALLSAQIITLALSKPLMGGFSDRHGRRPQIFFGALIGASCIGLFSAFDSFAMMLAMSVAFGFSISVVTSATSAHIADISRREGRGSAMGILGSVMDIGHTAGPLVAGFVAAWRGYPEAFLAASAVLVIAGAVFAGLVGIRKE